MNRYIQRAYGLTISALLIFVLGTTVGISRADFKEPPTNLSITKDDRILILAPHPDDEIIACGGIIQGAVETGAKLKILYLTEGEHNPISLIAYKKRLLFINKQHEFIELGNIRRQESTEAAKTLGVDKKYLVFLDYPDSGIRAIFTDHWGKGNEYKDSLTKLYRVEKGEGITPNAPYIAEAILSDIKKVIKEFRPTKIFCSHPLDQHSDHVGLYLFLKAVLLELRGEIQKPEVYLYIVHHRHWPGLSGFNPDRPLIPPEKLNGFALNWTTFKLSQGQIQKKRQAIMKFKSQIKYSKNYLLSFVRSNEIFSSDLKQIHAGDILKYMLKNETKIKDAYFCYKDGNLIIDIDFLKRIPDLHDIYGIVYLFGYQDKLAFKKMPKIRIGFRSNRWCIYNLEYKIDKSGATFKLRPNRLHFNIPLSLLGNPDLIFYSFKSNLSKTRIYSWSCWRIINLKH